MKKVLPYLKNKFVLASTLFIVYTMFLDEYDIFTILVENKKLNKLEAEKADTNRKLEETKHTITRLKHKSEVERFAREKKYFKKDDEDVFVIFYE